VGLYIRKSVKAGPFRLNLSKSGIGVSAGRFHRVRTGTRASLPVLSTTADKLASLPLTWNRREGTRRTTLPSLRIGR
jgi:hypothetical protein